MDSLSHCKLLFKMKLDELKRCLDEGTNYSLIQASNPIRSLLLDSKPLVDVLNKETRLPILYRINNNPWFDEGAAEGVPVIVWKDICPDLAESQLDVKKDKFLKTPCVKYWARDICVLDILKFYAYVRGGIHLDDGNKEYEPLREAFEFIKINNISFLDHSMRGIIQIISKTLLENKEKLLGV